MDLKLGYLADEKVPLDLAFNEADMTLVKNSEIARLIVEKLSKVRGKKVRKHLI